MHLFGVNEAGRYVEKRLIVMDSIDGHEDIFISLNSPKLPI